MKNNVIFPNEPTLTCKEVDNIFNTVFQRDVRISRSDVIEYFNNLKQNNYCFNENLA